MRAAGEEMRERIRQAIADLTARNNRPPTNREIGERLGGSGKPLSTGHIDYHLRIMRDQGLVTHDPKKSRGIMLTEAVGSAERAAQAIGITPFRVRVQGNIAAGRPIEAVTDPDDFVELAAPGVGGEGLYALRVRGKSMIEDLIDDNDVVIVRPQESVDNGDTVVALLLNSASEAGEVTLKRYYRERDRIRLQPANSTMEPIYVREQDLRIQGKVVAVIRQVG